MLSKHLSSNSLLVTTALVVLFGSAPLLADDFQFFSGEINYWNDLTPDPRPSLGAKKSVEAVGDTNPQTGDKSKGGTYPGGAFPWHQYTDPKNKEFFKEGDYTPPEPFMEIVRNPSDANLKMWFEYIAKKNELSSRLQTRMQEYLAKNSATLSTQEKERVVTRIAAMPKIADNVKRYRFRLYFDSHCPHCKRMFGTMTDLQRRGYFVEAKQIDHDTHELSGIPIPVEQATAAELQEKGVQSVPVLLVGDLTKKVVYRINGFQSTAQVLAALPGD